MAISKRLVQFKKEIGRSQKKQLISEILVDTAQLAFCFGLDPEELLRQNLFNKAKKVSYAKARKKS